MRTEPARRLLDLPRSSFATMAGSIARLVGAGEDVVNLCQGNPDLPTPPHIVEALRREVLDPATHRYPAFSGLLELKAAIAQWYAVNHRVELDPETEVAILFGAKAGLVEISQCFLNPGDVCLMPDPAFPDYWAGWCSPGHACTPSRSWRATASFPTTGHSTRPSPTRPS
ncbi:aminotransferase class I/II-fold pyridoxal phosphate-dependent enzyme [Streptomyces sp. MS1.HAVA.3]|uniref:Aminotransferase class I/II-fold pyridoxal phosphate-dependent enzyme n=1 Tax=Streptomyces caledonius TaxID=3134107 RepID=A0ABU8U0P7_9ACTN